MGAVRIELQVSFEKIIMGGLECCTAEVRKDTCDFNLCYPFPTSSPLTTPILHYGRAKRLHTMCVALRQYLPIIDTEINDDNDVDY